VHSKVKTYAEFRRCVNELELNLLKITTRSVNHEGFPEGDDTLLSARDRALEEEEVILDDTVVGEATHGSDRLLRDVVLGAGIVVFVTETNSINLLVDLRSMMVTIYEVGVWLK
jgi:hypothetical protein